MDEPTNLPPAPRRPSRLWRMIKGTGEVGIWTTGIVVSLVALAIVGVVWLSRQPEGHRLTFALANRALSESTNLRLSARRSLIVDHGAALVEPTVEIVDSLGVRHPWIVARRARLLTSWWGLLTRRPDDIYLTLDDPLVTFEKGPDGHWLLPRTRGGPGGKGGGGPLALDFIVHGGVVRVREAGRVDTLARAIDATLRLHGAGGTWDVAVGRLATYLPGPKLDVRKADGRARLANDRFALEHFRVRTDAGWMQVGGSGLLGDRRTFDGELEAGEWTWQGLARAIHQPHLDVSGGFAGRAHLRYDAAGLRIESGTADVLWRDEPAKVTFAGLWHEGRLRLDTSDVRWRGSAWHGAFDLVPASGEWKLVGRVTDLELADLPRVWPMPALDSLRATADVTLGGDKHGDAGRVDGGRIAWRGQALDSLAGTWSLAGDTQTLEARARAAGGAVSVRGTLAPRAMDLRVAAAGVRAEQVSARLWHTVGVAPAPAGRLESFEARLAGPPGAPALEGKGRVAGFARAPVTVDAAAFTLAGTLGKSYRVTADVAGAGAHAGAAHADSAVARIVLSPDRIEAPRFRAQRADSVLVLRGFATRADGAWSVELDSLDWHGGERLDLAAEGPVRFRVGEGGVVDLAPARVVSTAGAFTARGRWGGESEASDFTLDLESLDLEALLGPVATEREIQGVVTGHAHYVGPARHGAWEVALSGSALRYKARRAPHLVVDGTFAEANWRIQALDLDTGRGRVHLAGRIDWSAPPPWSGSTADWNRALASAPHWEGVLSTDSLAFGQISEFFPQAGGWRGALTVTANFAGRPTAPAFSAQGKLAGPGWGQASLGDFDLALDYHDEVLSVNRLAMAGPDSIGPAVRGTLPLRLGWGVASADRLPDRPMELHVYAHRLDLGLAPLLLPEIAEATGRADVTVDITGTPRHPHAVGALVVANGALRPAGREEVLTGVTGRVALAGNELRVESFTASQGRRGRIVVRPGGLAHLKDLRISDYAFSVTATNFTAFASGEYVLEANGAFDVVNGPDLGGPAPIPHITGRASLIEGTFLTNFGDPAAQAGWVGPAAQPPWTYDIQVEARNNLWWRPPDANIEGRLTDFEIVQDLDQFLLLGQVDALRGRYYFLGNQFDVKAGTLFFDRASPLNPTVDATLTTQKRLPGAPANAPAGQIPTETITIAVTGRAQTPNIALTSEPDALAPGEIASLLTAGQLQSGQGAPTVVGVAAVGYLTRQITRNPALAPVLGGLEFGTAEEKPFDQSASNTSAPGTGTYMTPKQQILPTLGMSRYLTRDLLVRYSQIVGDPSSAQRVDYQDLAAEYRLNQLLFLQGQVTRRRGSLVPSGDETLYNLDVRARYEY